MRRCKHIEILGDLITFKKKEALKYCKLRATLRNPSDCSVLSHSLNTVYAVRYAHPNCDLRSQLRIHLERYTQSALEYYK